MRLVLLSLAAAVVSALPARAEIISAYTDIDFEKHCSVFDSNTEGGAFVNFVCDGYKGYPILLYSGDLRESVFYGFPPEGDHVWESFGAFNGSGGKVEWRVDKTDALEVPFATINRWSVSDPEDAEKKTEVLVIEKVGQIGAHDGCAVGLVVATGNPQANETARKIADEQARDFACGADERVLVSGDVPMPEFSRQDN